MPGLEHAFTEAELVAQLQSLGVRPGGVLVVHSSFRAVRPVEHGPEGLIAALQTAVGPAGTLVMPSWTGDDETPFDPLVTPSSDDLGIVPQLFWQLRGVERSKQAMAFAARGPAAAQILADPLSLPPHRYESPIGRVHDLDGQVLLLGVGHDADTAIHLAEWFAQVPYGLPKHVTVLQGGAPVRLAYLEPDHCCERFSLADLWLRQAGLQAEGPVGHAQARLFRIRDVVRLALAALHDEPLIFLHPPEAGCADCDAARASIAR